MTVNALIHLPPRSYRRRPVPTPLGISRPCDGRGSRASKGWRLIQCFPQAIFSSHRVLLAFCAGALLLLGGCGTLVQVPLSAQVNASRVTLAEAERGYARVLQRHVNDQGEVDFAALRADASDAGIRALESYVTAISATQLDAAPTASARLAHMINAYNALSMYNVIDSIIPQSHDGFAKVKFFLLRKFVIGGTAMSLYAFENDIIRKLNEPRVHFALNCSAVSCPALPRVPFSNDALNEELDRETKKFFAHPENLRIDDTQRTVFFNEILKFYTEDFTPAHAQNLLAYAQRYSSKSIPLHYAVAFSRYDWTIANSKRVR